MSDWWNKLKDLLTEESPPQKTNAKIPMRDYDGNIAFLRNSYNNSDDLNVRELKLGTTGKRVAVIYLKTMTDKQKIASEVIAPLTSFLSLSDDSTISSRPLQAKEMLSSAELEETDDLNQAETVLLAGFAVILIDGLKTILVASVRSDLHRVVANPQHEATILGPNVGFVENSILNVSLLRQRLVTSKLRVEQMSFGTKNSTQALFLYIEDVAPQKIVDEVRQRMSNMNVDEIGDSSYLENLMGISSWSPFPQSIYTERPDRVSAGLLEGRVSVIVEGSPRALILPIGFVDLFQSPDDYYSRSMTALMMRLLRFLAFFIATTLPAVYVSLITFQYEVLPIDLTIQVATAREGVPLPPVVEVLLMLVIVDIMQEGVIRLPAIIGQTIGVVGGFILGQAVIQAGLVSPLLLITVAVAVLSGYAMPDYKVGDLVRLIRYLTVLAGVMLSGIGIMAVWTALLIHMASIEILGVPYLRPLAPLRIRNLDDFIFRRPYRLRDPNKSPRLNKGGGNSE